MTTIISQLFSGYQWVGLILLFVTLVLDAIDYYSRGGEKREGFLLLENAWARRIARLAFFVGSIIFVTVHVAEVPQETNPTIYVINICGVIVMNAALEVVALVVMTLIIAAIYHTTKLVGKGIMALFFWLTE